MHIRTDRHSTIKVSRATRERVDQRLALEAKRNEFTPTRRDFTTPRQQVKLTLKAAVQGFVWPTLI